MQKFNNYTNRVKLTDPLNADDSRLYRLNAIYYSENSFDHKLKLPVPFNLTETETEIQILIALAGIDEDEIFVERIGNLIFLEAGRQFVEFTEMIPDGIVYKSIGIKTGFERTFFKLPINVSNVYCVYKDGLLSIVIEKYIEYKIPEKEILFSPKISKLIETRTIKSTLSENKQEYKTQYE